MSKTTKKLFIRFNELPEDGHSFIYDENNIICGRRDGVSVYEAIKVDGVYTPKLPRYASKSTIEEFNKYTYNNTSGKYEKMYLVTGDIVATDERHCPIITNVEILDTLNFDEVFPGRRLTEDMAESNEEIKFDDVDINDTDVNTERVNRIDEFTDNLAETAHVFAETVSDACTDAAKSTYDFIDEVKTSKVYNNISDRIRVSKARISKFARATAAFAKVMLEKQDND